MGRDQEGEGSAKKKKGEKKQKGSKEERGGTAEGLPPPVGQQHSRVQCDIDAPKATQSVQYGGAYGALGVDTSWTMSRFRDNFKVQIISLHGDDLVFDLIHVDAAIANAFRRILLSEVPTMAIEKVFIADNTSLIQDEVLAHRLGLVPLNVDPRDFEYHAADGLSNEHNTVVFKLSHRCTKVGDKVDGTKVLSGMLEWMPAGSAYPPDQPSKKFTTFGVLQDTLPHLAIKPPAPTHPDIVLAKLRPGQAIELEAHAVKGLGKTHAKWSPVATASYRMLPEVHLRQAVEGAEAEELVKKCPMGVFDIEDMAGRKRAVVRRPRDCTLCLECVREEHWAQRVELQRVKDHFIFSVESTGSLPPNVLFTEAVKVLQDKASRILTDLS